MGTFVFKPFSLFTRTNGTGIWRNIAIDAYPTPSSDANIVAGFSGTSSASAIIHQKSPGSPTDPSTGKLVFLGNWYLDGSVTPLDINHLPAGFTITSADFLIKSTPNWDFDSTTHYYVTYANVNDTEITPHPASDTYTIPLTLPYYLLAINSFLGFRLDHAVAGGNLSYYNMQINGNYSLVSFSFTYTIQTPALNTIGPNNIFRMISLGGSGGSLNLSGIPTNGIDSSDGSYDPAINTGISGIALVWINLAGAAQIYYIPTRYLDPLSFDPLTFNPLTFNPLIFNPLTFNPLTFDSIGYPRFLTTALSFYIPLPLQLLLWQDPTIPGWPSSIPMTPYVFGDGTQFSGWVPLTALTVTLVNASGIYKIVPNKTNDTLYDNTAPPATNDVKIPNPFIKTGFVE